MRIGGVKAGGDGRPEILDYDSEKGFAIHNLRRVNFARAVLRSIGYGTIAPMRHCADDEADGLAQTMHSFSAETGIETYNNRLLMRIRDLPDYGKKTRLIWVGAILGVMDLNPQLVPETLAARAVTINYSRREDGGRKRHIDERGGVLSKAIKAGLKHVPAVPGGWGGD